LEIHKTRHRLKKCIPGRCLQAGDKYIKNCSKKQSLEIHSTSKILKNLFQGAPSKLEKNISKTDPNEPQFGDPENKENVQKSIQGRCLQAGEIISKLLQKNHSLEIKRIRQIFKK